MHTSLRMAQLSWPPRNSRYSIPPTSSWSLITSTRHLVIQPRWPNSHLHLSVSLSSSWWREWKTFHSYQTIPLHAPELAEHLIVMLGKVGLQGHWAATVLRTSTPTQPVGPRARALWGVRLYPVKLEPSNPQLHWWLKTPIASGRYCRFLLQESTFCLLRLILCVESPLPRSVQTLEKGKGSRDSERIHEKAVKLTEFQSVGCPFHTVDLSVCCSHSKTTGQGSWGPI